MRLQSYHDGHTLIVEDAPAGEIFIGTGDVEIEVTPQLLEWLCTISGPAVLHACRRAGESCSTCGGRGWHTAGGNDPSACGRCPAGAAWAEASA